MEPLLTDTFLIRTPLYYGQFTWSLRDRNPYKAYFSKTDTSIMRTLIPVPLVSLIKRFDCTFYCQVPSCINPCSNLIVVFIVFSLFCTDLFFSFLKQVWPITSFFDQQVNNGSKRLVEEHGNKWPSKRILLQVNEEKSVCCGGCEMQFPFCF